MHVHVTCSYVPNDQVYNMRGWSCACHDDMCGEWRYSVTHYNPGHGLSDELYAPAALNPREDSLLPVRGRSQTYDTGHRTDFSRSTWTRPHEVLEGCQVDRLQFVITNTILCCSLVIQISEHRNTRTILWHCSIQ